MIETLEAYHQKPDMNRQAGFVEDQTRPFGEEILCCVFVCQVEEIFCLQYTNVMYEPCLLAGEVKDLLELGGKCAAASWPQRDQVVLFAKVIQLFLQVCHLLLDLGFPGAG